MIFVTVGMHSQGFDRLIRKIDEIAAKIDEEVIMQIGHTKYTPQNARYFEFLEDFQKIKDLNRKARVIICHGGAGSIITAFKQGTPLIAVPRLKTYGEHIDNHQLELVDALAEDRKIIAVYDIEDLEGVLKEALDSPTINSPMKIGKDRKLVTALRKYINSLGAH